MSKRYNRREYLKLLGLTGAGIALASCAPAVAPTVAPAAPTAAQAAATEAPAAPAPPTKFKKTKLTVPSWWGPHEIAGAEASFAGTFKKNTGIDVKYDFIGSDFNAKVFTSLTSDNPYDVITFNADSVPVYLDKGVLLPLNDLLARDKYDTSNIVPSALSQWTYNGTIYGLTADMGSFHCYFNLDLFDKAGLKPPKPTDIWTWDQLADYAKKLTKKSGDQTTQYGFASGANWCWELWPNMNGSFVFDEAIKKSMLADPKTIQAFEFYQNMMYADGTALKPGATQTAPADLFIAGQLAIMMDGTWQVGYLRSKKADMKYKWDIGLLPKGPGTDKPLIPNFTAGWVIPKVAQDVDASWEAVKWYASDTFAKEVMFTSLSGLPCTKTVLEGAWYAQWPNNPPQGLTKEFYTAMLDNGVARRHLKFNLGDAIGASLSKLDLIYSNEKKPADLLPGLADDVTKALADRPWNKA